jgi:hypothetical protein
MARLSKDDVVVSRPVRTFPNGDYFDLELCRKNSRYECIVRLNSCGKKDSRDSSVVMARAQGKTIREAELNCYLIALERCPRFPSPPYFKRGERTRRVVSSFRNPPAKDAPEYQEAIAELVR